MPYLVGELVDLAPPGDDLLPYFVTWENDPALLRLSDSPSQAPRGWDGARSMFDALRSGPGLFYGIYAKGGHPIGYLGANIDDRDRRACVYIVVGDAGYQGRGYGTDAMRVLLRHLFDGLGLHRAYLFVHESNQRAIRCYEKWGSSGRADSAKPARLHTRRCHGVLARFAPSSGAAVTALRLAAGCPAYPAPSHHVEAVVASCSSHRGRHRQPGCDPGWRRAVHQQHWWLGRREPRRGRCR